MTDIKTDCAIIGGGIAGLWLLNVLKARGLQTVLIEREALGTGQTLAAQGLIHSGVKYTLGARLTAAAEAIATMPARWRQHFAGALTPSLPSTALLSKQFHMWSNAAISGRLGSFLASRALRGRVSRLDSTQRPDLFSASGFQGDVYQLEDFVIDTSAVLSALAAPWQTCLLRGQARKIESAGDAAQVVQLDVAGRQLGIHTHCIVLCAGAGNEALVKAMGRNSNLRQNGNAMQRRPLHQVFVAASDLPELYGHCVTGITSTEPRLTITSHSWTSHSWGSEQTRGERRVWAIGGALATTGIARSRQQQIEYAQRELTACLPWLHLDDPCRNARWATLLIDRAEAATATGGRPDQAFVADHDGLLLCWPTKLTLTPDLADRVCAILDARNLQPRRDADIAAMAGLPRPQLGSRPWETASWT